MLTHLCHTVTRPLVGLGLLSTYLEGHLSKREGGSKVGGDAPRGGKYSCQLLSLSDLNRMSSIRCG